MGEFEIFELVTNLRHWILNVKSTKVFMETKAAILVGALGGIGFAAIIIVGAVFLLFRVSATKEDTEGNQLAKIIKGTGDIESKLEHTTRRYCNVNIARLQSRIPKMRLNTIIKATNNFSKDSIIGSGRAGIVYKATMQDGSFLAIKRFHDSQYSGREFISDMMMLGRIKHRNVLPLLGFCVARGERILVYEYMPKGTLYHQLHDVKATEEHMEWPLRLRIAIGVARGLAWLHYFRYPCIIHRRISSKQIFLDEHYEPKISKFRSAKHMSLFDDHQSVAVNIPLNDLPYVGPEFRRKVVASRAGDVYSFGAMLLELITGLKPVQDKIKENLADWIARLSNNSQFSDAIDELLTGRVCCRDFLELVLIASSCIASDPDERPTMIEVFQLLRRIGRRHGFTGEDEIHAT